MKTELPLYLAAKPDISHLSDRDRKVFQTFSEKGYVIVDLGLTDLPEKIISEVQYQGKDTRRVQDAWKSCPSVKELALLAEAQRLLAMLYGRKAFAFQTLNFPVGTQQLTHSDTIHFSSDPPGFMAGVWVALEDIDAENGPLHYFPGSHRLPQITMDDLGVSGIGSQDQSLYREVYEPAIQQLTKDMASEEAYLRKGKALIWAANLLHGGSPILDQSRSRHSQVTHYYFGGCSYWTPLLSGDGERHMRYPYDIASGKSVTPLGQLPISESFLRKCRHGIKKFASILK